MMTLPSAFYGSQIGWRRRPEVERAPQPRRVLVVEDDEDFALGLKQVLQRQGFDPRVVSDPRSALEMLGSFPAQVALVDVRLGTQSGLELVAQLGERRPDVIAVVMTAYDAVDNAIQALRNGAYDYLTKPFAPAALGAALGRCFERLELERARVETEAARRTAEARFHALVDNALDITLVTDGHGRVRFASPALRTLLGYHPEGREADGCGVLDFIHPEDRGRAESTLARCALEEGASHTVEVRVRHRDGSWRWFEAAARGLFTDPAIAGVLISGRDVSHRRAIEDQLRQSQKIEALGQLTGGVAHDFNNLLAIIFGSLELIQRQRPSASDSVQELAGEGLQAAGRAATLVQRLLAFARKQTLSPCPTALDELVRGMTELLTRALGERVKLELALAPELWVCTVDAAQLETAVLNLALNARDAMAGGGRLRIATRNLYLVGETEVPAGRGQPHVAISVTDTGTGIPEELRPRIFEPFFTTKEAGRGTGLGLSMVFGFVKQSAGQILLESKVGEGTTISLCFPRSESPAFRPSDEIAEAPRARGEAILLVEDDLPLRAVISRQLEELGYEVKAVETGQAALEQLSAGLRPDLLLTDVVLSQDPGGYELAACARALVPGLKVLFTSGYAQEMARLAEPAAPGPLIAKPFRRADLACRVRDLLDSA
jgi:PAS domain S-box-containing protein